MPIYFLNVKYRIYLVLKFFTNIYIIYSKISYIDIYKIFLY